MDSELPGLSFPICEVEMISAEEFWGECVELASTVVCVRSNRLGTERKGARRGTEGGSRKMARDCSHVGLSWMSLWIVLEHKHAHPLLLADTRMELISDFWWGLLKI